MTPNKYRNMLTSIEHNKPTVVDFQTENLGNGTMIFTTIVQELTTDKDNTPILDAQQRALKAALLNLEERMTS